MDQVIVYVHIIGTKLSLFRSYLVNIVVGLTSLDPSYASLLLFVVIGYLFLVLFLFRIHRAIGVTQRKIVRVCIYEYDRIWYLTAKAMYFFNEEMKQAGKEQKLVHGTRSILSLKDKDYLHNQKKIFTDVKKLEEFLGKQIVDPNILKKIRRLHTKILSLNVFHKSVGWVLVVMTLGIFLIFWKRVYYR